jgi:hypothetical protein
LRGFILRQRPSRSDRQRTKQQNDSAGSAPPVTYRPQDPSPFRAFAAFSASIPAELCPLPRQPTKLLLDALSSTNALPGQSVERLAALSDGIFAVAMTLLVLDLRVPASDAVHTEHDLWHILIALSPRLLIFLMSVMTLGIFWVCQQTQLNQFDRAHN